MAIVTYSLGKCTSSSGFLVAIEIDYDNVTGIASRIRVINLTSHNVPITAQRQSDLVTRINLFPPGTTTFSFPTSPPSARFSGVTLGTRGRLNGITFYIQDR